MRQMRSPIGRQMLCGGLCVMTFWFSTFAVVGCGRNAEERQEPKPVSVFALRRSNPARQMRLTGSAEPWRQENVSFEVDGTVRTVIDIDTDVQGNIYDEQGQPLREGSVLATLDAQRYEIAVQQAQAQMQAAQANIDSLQTQIDAVLPAELEATHARHSQAENELLRLRQALSTAGGAATELEVEEQMAEVDVYAANIRQLEATIETRRADLAAAEADLLQAHEAMRTARLDLEDCHLRAPFGGRVSELLTINGAYVQPGTPIVQLTVMDPMFVVLGVSPQTDRQLATGQPVAVYPPGASEAILGHVYSKSTIADPALRTFTVKILVRNQRVFPDVPDTHDIHSVFTQPALLAYLPDDPEMARFYDDPTLGALLRNLDPDQPLAPAVAEQLSGNARFVEYLLELTTVVDTLPVQVSTPGATAPLYAETRCILPDGKGGHFVWRIGVRNGEADSSGVQILQLRNVPVRIGEGVMGFSGIYLYREIEEVLAEPNAQPMLSPNVLLAVGVPAWAQQGSRLLSLERTWQFRPSDLVDVDLQRGSLGEGFYVPMEAIVVEAGPRYSICVVETLANGASLSRKLEVRLIAGDQVGEWRRVEGLQQPLEEGMSVVLDGANLLLPDEPVNVVEQLDIEVDR